MSTTKMNLGPGVGSELIDGGQRGHINSESGLGAWQQGHDWLLKLLGDHPNHPNHATQANHITSH